jgi:guanylate kinase
MAGKCIIFSAPSGAGKTTLVQYLLKQNLGLEFSISACSRHNRPKELHGKDYYFLSVNDFRRRIDEDEFVEWEEVYANMFYGTLKSEIQRIWDKGNTVIFDVDVVGGKNLKANFGDDALAIFVKAPSIEHLANRLRQRDTETEESIARRMAKAEQEMGFAESFDVVIVNDNLELAKAEALKVVQSFLAES